MNKMPIKHNLLINNMLGKDTSRTGAGHGPVPCPSKAKWENERKEDEV